MYLLEYILARLQEPSTYAGLGSLLLVFGCLACTSPDTEQKIIAALIAIASAAACFLPEANPDRD